MTPDWQRDGIRLYCGDCLEVLPQLGVEPKAVEIAARRVKAALRENAQFLPFAEPSNGL